MRKLLLIAALFSLVIAKAQNPVSQPQYFLTWIKVKDSARVLGTLFIGTTDTAATKAYARSLVASYNTPNWDTAYQRMINSLAFSSGNLSLLKQNGSALTISLDGRWLKISDTANMLTGYARTGNVVPYGGTSLTTGSLSYSVPAGTLIDKILITDPSTITMTIGTTLNGRELCTAFQVSSGVYSCVNLSKFFASASTIYFNGATSNTIIKVYRE